MGESPFINFYTSDFLAGTGGMTAATKGVYITILCLIYETEGALGQKWDVLARRCGCTLPAFKRAISDLVDDGKLEIVDGQIWSEKCEKHLTQRRERQSSARSAAKKRWQKSKQKQGQSNAAAMQAQCQPKPEPDIKEDTNVSSQKKRGSRLPEDWVLPREWGEWALSEGWPEQVIREQADRFKDYWISETGQKATKRDWFATWRNWMRNSKSPKVLKGGQHDQGNHSGERLQRIISAAAGGTSGKDWG